MVNKSDFENINSEWRLILNTKNYRFNNMMGFETLIDEIINFLFSFLYFIYVNIQK